MSRISLAEVLPVELTAYTAPECTAARARIESARIRAQKTFFKARQQDPPTGFSGARHDLYSFLDYVVTVWFTLNHELCVLGRRRKWRHVLPADHIRLLSERFREDFTIFIAHPEDGRNRYGQPFEHVIEHYLGHSSTLSLSFQKTLDQHELWHAAEEELEAAAEHQGGKPRKKALPPPEMHEPALVQTKRRRPSTITKLIAAKQVETYVLSEGGGDLDEFAAKVGISTRTLRSFFKTGTIRRSIAKDIAEVMGIPFEKLFQLK